MIRPARRAAPPPPGDPGLQAERTRLAWRRTTLSITVVLLFATARVVDRNTWAATAGVATIGLILVAALVVTHRRVQTLTAEPAHSPTAAWAPAALGLLIVATAVAGTLVVA